jgi:hypothetical protein
MYCTKFLMYNIFYPQIPICLFDKIPFKFKVPLCHENVWSLEYGRFEMKFFLPFPTSSNIHWIRIRICIRFGLEYILMTGTR